MSAPASRPRIANAPYAEVLDALAELLAPLVAEHLAAMAQPQAGPEPWIDVKAAAEHIAAPRSRIYRLVESGRIPHERDGARLLFRRSALDQWVANGGGISP